MLSTLLSCESKLETKDNFTFKIQPVIIEDSENLQNIYSEKYEKKDTLKDYEEKSYDSLWNHCNVQLIYDIHINKEILTDSLIFHFLKSFTEECQYFVETSQLSNEILFELLDTRTDKILAVLSKSWNNLDTLILMEEMKNPIHDGFDLNRIIKKIESSKLKNRKINVVLACLKEARDKNN